MYVCECECTRNIIHRPCDSLDFNASRSEAEKCSNFEYVLPHDKWVPNFTRWRCRKGKQGRGVSLCEGWDHQGVYCIVICYLLPCYYLFMFYVRISFAIFSLQCSTNFPPVILAYHASSFYQLCWEWCNRKIGAIFILVRWWKLPESWSWKGQSTVLEILGSFAFNILVEFLADDICMVL